MKTLWFSCSKTALEGKTLLWLYQLIPESVDSRGKEELNILVISFTVLARLKEGRTDRMYAEGCAVAERLLSSCYLDRPPVQPKDS